MKKEGTISIKFNNVSIYGTVKEVEEQLMNLKNKCIEVCNYYYKLIDERKMHESDFVRLDTQEGMIYCVQELLSYDYNLNLDYIKSDSFKRKYNNTSSSDLRVKLYNL